MESGAEQPFVALERAIRRCHDLFDPAADAPLDECALAISAVLQPRLDIAAAIADLDRLAGGCRATSPAGVIEYLVDDVGVCGAEEYEDWRNSCLDLVMARRVGLPITLATLAIEVGRRCGVDLVGIGMPMHFLVGDRHDPDWFVDLFGAGASDDAAMVILDRPGCRRLFDDLGGTHWSETYLDPVAPRSIILRMLNNLRAHCAGDPIRTALVMRLRALCPEFAGETPGVFRSWAVLN